MLKTSLPLHRQRGISLLESMVAIVVMALGILGILGVQMRTLTDTQTSVRRAQAIRLIEDFSERMKVNPNALGNIANYTSDWTATPPTAAATKSCATASCSHGELATYDLAEWKRAVERTLPLGNANVFLAQGETVDENRRQLGVMISWRENERNVADNADRAKYKDAIDTGTGAGTGTTAVKCPDDRTCHVQFIPVSARCAPYFAGATVQYFCPGS